MFSVYFTIAVDEIGIISSTFQSEEPEWFSLNNCICLKTNFPQS